MIDVNTIQEAIKAVTKIRVSGDLELHEANITTLVDTNAKVILGTNGEVDLLSMTPIHNYSEILSQDVPASHVNKAAANTKTAFLRVLNNVLRCTTNDMKFCRTIGHTINANPELNLHAVNSNLIIDVAPFSQMDKNSFDFMCCMLASGSGFVRGVIYVDGLTKMDYHGVVAEIQVKESNRERYAVRGFSSLVINGTAISSDWQDAIYTFENKGE